MYMNTYMHSYLVSPAWLSACSKAKAWRAPEALEQVRNPHPLPLTPKT